MCHIVFINSSVDGCSLFFNETLGYQNLQWYGENSLLFKKILFIYFWRGGKEGRKREWEKHWSGASHMPPHQGPSQPPRLVPWRGIEPETFWFSGQHPPKWATAVQGRPTLSLKQEIGESPSQVVGTCSHCVVYKVCFEASCRVSPFQRSLFQQVTPPGPGSASWKGEKGLFGAPISPLPAFLRTEPTIDCQESRFQYCRQKV